MSTENLLQERGSTHGLFSNNAVISQSLKEVVRSGVKYSELTAVQKEALDMTLHKISRIVSGNPFEDDHWLDGGNYLHLSIKFNHGKPSKNTD